MDLQSDNPKDAVATEVGEMNLPPQHIGKYQVIRTLGAGGMGEVYLAEDTTSGQRVALKLLQHQASKKPRMRRRFERESNVIQDLQHDHIVPLLDAGVEQGMQYLVMRYIDGQTLAERIAVPQGCGQTASLSIGNSQDTTAASAGDPLHEDHPDSFEFIATSIANIADALQVAHDERVIHRDIKPANLIFDQDEKIWLADFGLAFTEDDRTALTMTGDVLGTPAYMSPEQTLGSQTDVTRRSDVYSLGATLYEWATLQRPFSGNREQILVNIANGSVATPRSLRAELPPALEAIICTAMSRSPEARYPTAAAFSDDLRRFAAGQPVRAKMPGWTEKLARWRRRNPMVALASLIGVITTIMAVLGMQAMHSDQLTRVNAQLAESNDELIKTNLELESREAQLSKQLYVSDMSLAFQAYKGNNLRTTKQLLDKHRLESEEATPQRFAYRCLDYLVTPPPSVLLTQHNGPATEVAISNDGKIAISVSHDGEVHVIDLATKQRTHQYKLPGRLDAIAISPDNQHFLTGLNGDVGFNGITVREIATGKETLELLGHWHNVESAAFSSDGEMFATAGRYRNVQVHDREGRVVKTFYGGSRNESVQFAGDGHLIAYVKEVDSKRRLSLLDLDSGKEIEAPVNDETTHFSTVDLGDGIFRMFSYGAKDFKIADSTNTEYFAKAFAMDTPVRCVGIAANGEDLFNGTDDGTVYAWTLTNRAEDGFLQAPLVFQASKGQVSSLQALPDPADSARIVTAGEDGSVRLWDLKDKLPVRPNPRGRTFPSAHVTNIYSPDDNPFDVFVKLSDNTVWHYDPRRDLHQMQPIESELKEWGTRLASNADASMLVVTSEVEVEVRDLQAKKLLAKIVPPHRGEPINDAKFVDGKLCVLLPKLLLVYDVENFELIETHELPSDNFAFLYDIPNRDALMLSSSSMLSIYEDSSVSIFEATASTAVRYSHVSFDSTAKQIAIVFDDRLVEIRSFPENETTAVLRGHSRPIGDCIFLDRGRTVATTGDEGVVRFWDLASERELGALPTGEHYQNQLHYIEDADMLMLTSIKRPTEMLMTKNSREKLARAIKSANAEQVE
ncbi:serine/threonine-protein kinase [Rhodopirellula bahusiensis]|uniref:Serine/threonine protein kinase n=1 Tax=Rhodopirellula bahusiensis TaxID=2014065 RepID=A0A2G1WC13_9BACT|nr:serine/threonine-protein kinase [Rhodopirellula bahusiensis]PHQ36551.1 serine/threonine protein kinase [Rhodopirellula bahusiensis]